MLSIALIPLGAGCEDKKGEDKPKEETKKTEDATEAPKEEPKEEAKAPEEEPKPEGPAEIVLVNQDITAQVKDFFEGFKGTKIEMMLPEGAKISKGMGGFKVEFPDAKTFALEVGLIHDTAKVIKDIEDGKSLLEEAKIIEKSDAFVIQQGKYMGTEGHSLNMDLESVTGSLKTGCRTPTGRLYPEPTIRKILEACQSFKVTK